METFDFPFHRWKIVRPQSGIQLQYGNSYLYVSAPEAPDQRTFVLTLPAMKYYTNSNGTLNTALKPETNMVLLEQFYEEHRLWKEFIYPNPRYGNIVCRFKEPLETPEGEPGGNGLILNVTVSLIEQP